MKLFIAADHAGFELKEKLKKLLPNIAWSDVGTHSLDSVHYPHCATKFAEAILSSDLDLMEPCGVIICGSGIGVSIATNRFPELRAALVWNQESARLAREHNRANVLCLGARFVTADEAAKFVNSWLEAKFLDGRHAVRVEQLGQINNGKDS